MDSDYRTKIGKLISELRTSHGLTQTQLADELGTSQSAINRIERGAQNVSLEIIARISDVLNSEIISLGSSSKSHHRSTKFHWCKNQMAKPGQRSRDRSAS